MLLRLGHNLKKRILQLQQGDTGQSFEAGLLEGYSTLRFYCHRPGSLAKVRTKAISHSGGSPLR